jgi:hypothetical protein
MGASLAVAAAPSRHLIRLTRLTRLRNLGLSGLTGLRKGAGG